PPREEQAGGRTGHGKDNGFGHELTDDARAARAERAAECEISSTGGATSEEKARDVRTRDGQHEGDRACEHEQRPLDGAPELIADPDERCAAAVIFRMGARQTSPC